MGYSNLDTIKIKELEKQLQEKVMIILPEKKYESEHDSEYGQGINTGWNEALIAIRKLNPRLFEAPDKSGPKDCE